MENLKKFLNEKQNVNVVKKVHTKISELLTSKEEIEYIAVQNKPAINISPDSIALTSKRVIFCRPKSFGLSLNFQDFLWKDIVDCHIREGILGATFYVKSVKNRRVSLDYLPKSQARLLYRFAQEKEEEMSEFRRQRELEHNRASAGGIIMNTMENKPIKDTMADPVESLKKLKIMLENDLISQNEFEVKKEEIIMKM